MFTGRLAEQVVVTSGWGNPMDIGTTVSVSTTRIERWALRVSILALVLSLPTAFIAFRQSGAIEDELALTQAQVDELARASEREVIQAEVSAIVGELLRGRLASGEPRNALYHFPLDEFYNLQDVSEQRFEEENAAQRERYADAFQIIREIDWDSAILTRDSASVVAELVVVQDLEESDQSRICSDTRQRRQIVPVTLQLQFVRRDGRFGIVSERSASLDGVRCAGT